MSLITVDTDYREPPTFNGIAKPSARFELADKISCTIDKLERMDALLNVVYNEYLTKPNYELNSSDKDEYMDTAILIKDYKKWGTFIRMVYDLEVEAVLLLKDVEDIL